MNAEIERAWAARDHLAARIQPMPKNQIQQIVRGLTRRCSGFVTSRKNDASMPWRAREERDLMCIFELDHGILSYGSLCEEVEFVLDGKHHRVVPAARAWTTRGPMAFDVLRSDGPASNARQRVIDAVADTYAAAGIGYRCIDRQAVRLEPRRSNVAYARSYKGIEPDDQARLAILELLSIEGSAWDIASLRDRLGAEADGLFHLAMLRVLRLDLSASEPTAMRVSLGAIG